MPVPIQPPAVACSMPRPKGAPAKPRSPSDRLHGAQGTKPAQKQTAQPADDFVAAQGQTASKLPVCRSGAAAPSKLSFVEALAQLDRKLEHSAYYAVSARPPK
jgi:hypothetical protein